MSAGDVARADDGDLEQPVGRVAVVRDGEVELDLREVDEDDGDAVGGEQLAVEPDAEVGDGRRQVAHDRQEVRADAERRLQVRGALHHLRVEAGARHDREADAAQRRRRPDLAEVRATRRPFAARCARAPRGPTAAPRFSGSRFAVPGGIGEDAARPCPRSA